MNEFTTWDDRHLVAYIALNSTEQKDGVDGSLFKRLVASPKRWPWSARHSWSSWFERYTSCQERFDDSIQRYREKSKFKTIQPSPSSLTHTSTRCRYAFTTQDDRRLVKFLASLPPNELGHKYARRGNAAYRDILVANPEKYPWAKNHPWQSWRNRYVKSSEMFDNRIAQWRMKHGVDQVARQGDCDVGKDVPLSPEVTEVVPGSLGEEQLVSPDADRRCPDVQRSSKRAREEMKPTSFETFSPNKRRKVASRKLFLSSGSEYDEPVRPATHKKTSVRQEEEQMGGTDNRGSPHGARAGSGATIEHNANSGEEMENNNSRYDGQRTPNNVDIFHQTKSSAEAPHENDAPEYQQVLGDDTHSHLSNPNTSPFQAKHTTSAGSPPNNYAHVGKATSPSDVLGSPLVRTSTACVPDSPMDSHVEVHGQVVQTPLQRRQVSNKISPSVTGSVSSGNADFGVATNIDANPGLSRPKPLDKHADPHPTPGNVFSDTLATSKISDDEPSTPFTIDKVTGAHAAASPVAPPKVSSSNPAATSRDILNSEEHGSPFAPSPREWLNQRRHVQTTTTKLSYNPSFISTSKSPSSSSCASRPSCRVTQGPSVVENSTPNKYHSAGGPAQNNDDHSYKCVIEDDDKGSCSDGPFKSSSGSPQATEIVRGVPKPRFGRKSFRDTDWVRSRRVVLKSRTEESSVSSQVHEVEEENDLEVDGSVTRLSANVQEAPMNPYSLATLKGIASTGASAEGSFSNNQPARRLKSTPGITTTYSSPVQHQSHGIGVLDDTPTPFPHKTVNATPTSADVDSDFIVHFRSSSLARDRMQQGAKDLDVFGSHTPATSAGGHGPYVLKTSLLPRSGGSTSTPSHAQSNSPIPRHKTKLQDKNRRRTFAGFSSRSKLPDIDLAAKLSRRGSIRSSVTTWTKDSPEIDINSDAVTLFAAKEPKIAHPEWSRTFNLPHVLPEVDSLKAQQHATRSSLPELPPSTWNLIIRTGLATIFRQMEKNHGFSSDVIRRTWVQQDMDLNATDRVLLRMRLAAEKALNDENEDCPEESGPSLSMALQTPEWRAKTTPYGHCATSEMTASSDAYYPPARSRAAHYRRLSEQGRLMEARQHEIELVGGSGSSGGSSTVKKAGGSLEKKKARLATPVWCAGDDKILRGGNEAMLRVLADKFGEDVIRQKFLNSIY